MPFPIRFRFVNDEEDDKPISWRFGSSGQAPVRPSAPETHYSGHHQEEQQKGFVLEWDRALGFSQNPFVDKVLTPTSHYIAGYQDAREKLNLFVINENTFGVIMGSSGIGKSFMMQWLFEQLSAFKAKLLPIYISGDSKSQQPILSDIVVALMSAYERTVKKGQLALTLEGFASWIKKKADRKKLVLLIDGAKRVAVKDIQLFNLLFKAMPALIIVAETKEGYEKSIFSRISKMADIKAEYFEDTLKLTLEGLSFEEAREMLQKRIEAFGGHDISPFHDPMLKALHKRAEGNPKELLELCKKKAIELSVKHSQSSLDLTKQEKEIEKIEAKEEKAEAEEKQTADTPTQRGFDYKIEVVNRGHDFIMIEEEQKGDKEYTIRAK